MVSMVLTLIEKNSVPEKILYRHLQAERANILFSQITKEFSNFQVEKSRENRPYLYLKLVDLLGISQDSMADFMPNACFKIEAREQIVNFINKIEKP